MMTFSISNLSLMRCGKRVLYDVSSTLERGSITAIVGPNGAGKSSLLMALAGLLSPASGDVALDGVPLTNLSSRSRACALGYLPQNGDIAWDVTVQNLIALGRMPHGDSRSEQAHQAIEAAISSLALQDLRDRPTSQLSGGERARVLLARVLAGEPKWILADEPYAALDLKHQLSLITHFKACAQADQGVVLVLHDLATAMNHADRVLVLHEGHLIADGVPEQTLSHHTIAKVWGVEAKWIGANGARALVI